MIIVTNPDNILSQPYQIVAISWENNYEVMLLGTSIYANQKDVGVQILPLPSVPSVELGNTDSLKKIVEMYYEYEFGKGVPTYSSGGVTLIFEKVLGPHHLICLEIEKENLVNCILDYASKHNISITINPSQFFILSNYVAKGYKYFLVDIVNVSNDTNFIQPLIVKFKTDHIWFPLYISSLYSGRVHIYVLIITRKIPKIPKSLAREFEINGKIISRWDIADIDERLLEPFAFGYYFWATFLQKYEYASELRYDIVINEFNETLFTITAISGLIPLFFICLIAVPLVSKRFRMKVEYNITKRYAIGSLVMLISSIILLILDIPLCIFFLAYSISNKIIAYGILLASLLQFSLMFVIGYSIFVLVSYITKISGKINNKILKLGSSVLRIMFDIIIITLLLSLSLLLIYFWVENFLYVRLILIFHWLIIISVFTIIPCLDLYETIKKALQKSK